MTKITGNLRKDLENEGINAKDALCAARGNIRAETTDRQAERIIHYSLNVTLKELQFAIDHSPKDDAVLKAAGNLATELNELQAHGRNRHQAGEQFSDPRNDYVGTVEGALIQLETTLSHYRRQLSSGSEGPESENEPDEAPSMSM